MPFTVLFFISGHGFGHASREVEIIHALAADVPDIRILIRSAVNPALLKRTLAVPFELRPGPCDTGIVQKSSIAQDDEATVRETIRFYDAYDTAIDAEMRALAEDDVSIVVGDIAPIAFEVAARLDTPSLAIGNFTWDWIYDTHPGLTAAAPWLLPRIRASYEKAGGALELPFSGGFDVFARRQSLPLVARRPSRSRRDTRAHFDIAPERPAALLSFGGYGLPDMDLSRVACLDDWTIVTTDPLASTIGPLPPSVRLIAEEAFIGRGFRYEDLVGAVDVVITKPGYGILAECISTGTAMLYTSRGIFREYDLMVREMPRFVRSRFIAHDDLLGGSWRRSLEGLMAQPPATETMAVDGAEHAAAAIRRAAVASTSG